MFRAIDWRLITAWLYYRATGRQVDFIYFDDTVKPSRVRATFTGSPPSATVDLETGALAVAVAAPLFRREP